jgi:predicted ATPase
MKQSFTMVITGGSCSGKTSLVEEMGRRFGSEVSTIPEAASWVIRQRALCQSELSQFQRRELQREIYTQQIAWEATAREQFRIVLLDRGTVDGAAYWPGGCHEFWEEMGTSQSREIARYDSVLWLESAAVIGQYDYGRSNPSRTEDPEESIRLGNTVRHLWSPHPNLCEIAATTTFAEKRNRCLELVDEVITRRLNEPVFSVLVRDLGRYGART